MKLKRRVTSMSENTDLDYFTALLNTNYPTIGFTRTFSHMVLFLNRVNEMIHSKSNTINYKEIAEIFNNQHKYLNLDTVENIELYNKLLETKLITTENYNLNNWFSQVKSKHSEHKPFNNIQKILKYPKPTRLRTSEVENIAIAYIQNASQQDNSLISVTITEDKIEESTLSFYTNSVFGGFPKVLPIPIKKDIYNVNSSTEKENIQLTGVDIFSETIEATPKAVRNVLDKAYAIDYDYKPPIQLLREILPKLTLANVTRSIKDFCTGNKAQYVLENYYLNESDSEWLLMAKNSSDYIKTLKKLEPYVLMSCLNVLEVHDSEEQLVFGVEKARIPQELVSFSEKYVNQFIQDYIDKLKLLKDFGFKVVS